MISKIKTLEEARELSMNIIKAKDLTYEQKTSQLAKQYLQHVISTETKRS